MLELLKIARETGINLCMVSSAGTGKSTIVETFAKELGVHCETLIVSNMESTEIVGIPYISKDDSGKGSLESAKPEWLKNLEKHGGNGILFIDEVSNARPDVQTPLLSMLTARKAGVYDIPKDVQFVFAMNDSISAVDYYEMGEALRDRLCFVEHTFSKSDFKKVFKDDQDIVNVIDLIKKPQNTKSINIQNYVVESYRTYGEYVNNLLKYVEKHYNEVKLSDIQQLLMGMLSLDNANIAYNFVREDIILQAQMNDLDNKEKNDIDGLMESTQNVNKIYKAYSKLHDKDKELFDHLLEKHLSHDKLVTKYKTRMNAFKNAIVENIFADKNDSYEQFTQLSPLHLEVFKDYLMNTSVDRVSKKRSQAVEALFTCMIEANTQARLNIDISSIDTNNDRLIGYYKKLMEDKDTKEVV